MFNQEEPAKETPRQRTTQTSRPSQARRGQQQGQRGQPRSTQQKSNKQGQAQAQRNRPSTAKPGTKPQLHIFSIS